MSIISDLKSWDEISVVLFAEGMEKSDSPYLLIGNGASIAVSSDFDYDSLFDEANLSDEDKAVFEAFETTNFEFVLRALSVAKLVNTHLEVDDEVIDTRYEQIRAALIEVVGRVHLEREQFYSNPRLGEEYLKCKSIYTTNYDLLLYWSLMERNCLGREKAVDMYPNCYFNAFKEYHENCTKVFYLHGALHLYRNAVGCQKLKSREGDPLLEQIRRRVAADIHFVSEGTWKQKRKAINESVYLNFVFDEFRREKNDLIVFGFSFDEETDKHIIDAIKKCRGRRLAVSIYRGKKTDPLIVAEMDTLRGKLSASCDDLFFFDAATHPLGNNGSIFRDESGNTAR